MDYLYLLQQLRDGAPQWLNEAILFVSEFVGGTGGLALMALIYWCINKRAGLFLMMNFSLSYVCNGVIKNIFCVERPFLRDTRLTPYVPASGYSFPSGHTMLATGFYGGVAVWQQKRRWLAALCVLLALLTGLTRNWLGVHTLEDVLVGMACSAVLIAANARMLRWVDKAPGRDLWVLAGSGLILAAYCLLFPSGMKAAGIYGGVMLGWLIERRWIRFQISESIGFRAFAFAAGIGVVALLQNVLLPLLCAPLQKGAAALLICFFTYLAITAGWPMVLKLLMNKRMNNKQEELNK